MTEPMDTNDRLSGVESSPRDMSENRQVAEPAVNGAVVNLPPVAKDEPEDEGTIVQNDINHDQTVMPTVESKDKLFNKVMTQVVEKDRISRQFSKPRPAQREVNYTFHLIFSIIICVFGNSFLYGYNIGDVNNPAGVIREFYWDVLDERGTLPADARKLVTTNTTVTVNNKTVVTNSTILETKDLEHSFISLLWAITVAIFVLFGMIGAFISGAFADYFGRKKGMIIITFIMFLAAICGGIPIATRAFEALIVHRALVGLHCGINVSLASLYLAEISPKKIRGAVGTCHQLFITVGILWSNIMGVSKLFGTKELWIIVFIFNAIPAFVCLVCMPFCPESPRWLLIKKSEEQQAREALRKLRGYFDVEDEIEEMKVEARKSQSVQTYTLKQLLTAVDLRIPVFIACAIQVSQQWSGINAVMSYSSFMYKNAGVDKTVIEWVVCGTSTINVLATIFAVPLMEKLGRRPLLIYPMVCMVLSFVVLAIFHNLQYDPSLMDSHGSFAIIGIIAMHTYVIGFALGLGPIPFIVVGEIFRQEPRAAAMSLSLTFNWICNFILMLVFPFMSEALKGYVYLPFIVILVLAILFIFFMVPETKNRTFDDIAQSIAHGKAYKSHKALPYQDGNDQEMEKINT